MDTKDEILMEAFLLRVSPETVYEWLKAWPQRTPEEMFRWNNIPEAIESQLLGRHNEIIDLGLAAWGSQRETLATLYRQWCARSAVVAWPPQPSTFAYAVLAAILANVNNAGVIFGRDDQKDDTEDFDWLIEHGDDNLLFLMHSNIGPAIGLLKRCAARNGAYGRIDDHRWLTILGRLGENKRLHIPAKEYDDSPDFTHMEIHDAFVEAARISPKTPAASAVFWTIFVNLPTKATAEAYIKDEVLNAAVSAWNVEIANNDPYHSDYSKYDGLTHAERVQFHLLRRYGRRNLDLDPNDPNRVRRLAAYANNPVVGDRGLVVGDFQKYADRDGPAFVYATSLNCHIYRKRANAASSAILSDFPHPEDLSLYISHINECRAAVGTEDKFTDAVPEEDTSVAAQTLKAVASLRAESSIIYEDLKIKINRVERFVLWGGLVLLVLVLFFRH